MDYRVVLASASPRRRELLDLLGIEYETWPSNEEENPKSTLPEEICCELSKMKALSVASMISTYNKMHPELVENRDILVIGADTLVAVDGEILGKPKDENDAERMLRKLSGNMHSVYSGVTFVFMKGDRVGEHTFFEKTDVTFRELDDKEIRSYIDTGEPMDKAGAYGIQGKALPFVSRIEGDVANVVGLPVSRLVSELKNLGVDL